MDILEFLARNKEWLFSGAGLIILGASGRWLRRLYRARRTRGRLREGPPPPPATLPLANTKHRHLDSQTAVSQPATPLLPHDWPTGLDPDDIVDATSTGPLINRQTGFRNFIGTPIAFVGQLCQVQRADEGRLKVQAHTLRHMQDFVFELDSTACPELLIAQGNLTLAVYGIIDRDTFHPTLRD